MGIYVKLSEVDTVEQVVVSVEPIDGFIEVALEPRYSMVDVGYMMLVNGVLVPRPVSPKPYSDSGKIIVPPCPEGTLITVLDQSGHEVMAMIVAENDDHEETFEFVDAGTYRVEVEAPSPHIYSFAEVTIE